jgi:hypothetical protein
MFAVLLWKFPTQHSWRNGRCMTCTLPVISPRVRWGWIALTQCSWVCRVTHVKQAQYNVNLFLFFRMQGSLLQTLVTMENYIRKESCENRLWKFRIKFFGFPFPSKSSMSESWSLLQHLYQHPVRYALYYVLCLWWNVGYAVKLLVYALRYKPAGLGFISWWHNWNFSSIHFFR